MTDESKVIFPGFYGQYSHAFFDFMKTWADSFNKNKLSPTDWRIWLPRAFYLNWSDSKTSQKSMLDPTIWLPMTFYPQEERERFLHNYNIAGDNIPDNMAGGDIINSPILTEIKEKYGQDVSKALKKISEIIKKSNDHAAGSVFDSFIGELNKPHPDKFRLRRWWSALETMLPTISEVASKIVPLLG
jgi:hypothetical protein